MIVADSGVLIDFLRGEGTADRIALELKTGRLATTAISAFELRVVADSSAKVARVEMLMDALNILALEKGSARKAGEVRRQLEAQGETISMADSLVAGICLEHSALLLTRNRRSFERIEGLKLSGSTR